MIFDPADVMRMPWEIVVKGFRKNLEKRLSIQSTVTRKNFLRSWREINFCFRRRSRKTLFSLR
jgi:hypothetical protein